MSRYHDKWYTRLFSDPKIVQELLESFVHEKFVQELDFSTIKKLNTRFVPVSGHSRQADLVFEVKANGQAAYIYLFLEFQSTVDRFMALRMNRYITEFYEELRKIEAKKQGKLPHLLNPPFPILIYNGSPEWTAPEQLSELFYPSSIPTEYIPEFKYFKIAINEIPKRELVKIRNAVSAVFYIENCSAAEMTQNRKTLVSLLRAVLKNDGKEILTAIVNRILDLEKLPKSSKTISTIEDLMEVSTMLEENTKKWEAAVLEKGIEKGIEQGIEKRDLEIVEKMIHSAMSNADIRKITGMALIKIEQIRKRLKRK